MGVKNKIKIDSFKVDKLTPYDLKDILKLAILAQASFGLTDKKSPSLFLKEMTKIILDNIPFSFVYKDNNDKIFGAFIIKAETNISAEFILLLSNPDVAQTEEMYKTFFEVLNQMKFKIFFAKIYKKRKKFNAYVRFLNVYGFDEKIDENEDFLTVCYKKA